MTLDRKKLLRALLFAASATVGTASPHAAFAQTQSDDDGDSVRAAVDEIVVRGSRTPFRVEDTSTATLVPLAIENTPFNIGVITEQVIDDLQINTLRDAVLMNASVTHTHSHSTNATGFTIRGFAQDADRLGYLVNGVPVASFDAPPAHTSALDRIEILKGAAALHYGAGEPAGIINYVYKQPQETAEYNVSATIGQFDQYRAELDATGPLGTDSLLYRFTLGWQDSDGVVDFDYSKDFAPTLQLLWKATDNTNIRFIGEHVEHEGNPISTDAFFLNGNYLRTPKEQYLGFTTDYEEQDSTGLQLQLDHQLNDSLKIMLQAAYKDGGRDAGNSGYLAFSPIPLPPGFSDPESGLALRSVFDQRRRAESEYAAAHLIWDFETEGTSHQFLVGVNYSESEILNIGNFNSIASLVPAIFANPALIFTLPPSVNIFDPEPIPYEHTTNFNDSPPFNRNRWQYDNVGLNIQDAIEIPSMNVNILLGLRYAESGGKSVESLLNDGSPGAGFVNGNVSESAWIPRAGITFDITDNHSVYASYGESFLPALGSSLDTNGNPITVPEEGVQYEVGWRGKFFDGRLGTTLALYDLTKENIIVPTGIPDVSEVAGEQRARGVELDMTGQITDSWDLYLSYAYTDTEVVDGGTTGQTDGSRFTAVPLHKLVAWTNVSMDWTGVEGFRFGYGIDYLSESLAGALVSLNPLVIGQVFPRGQGVVHNATLSYNWQNENRALAIDLAVRNVTDRFYVLNTSNTIFAKRGEPRTVLLTASMSFF
ncbi:MAG: TonB-dependent receptor [Pseudomonadota bacterium]